VSGGPETGFLCPNDPLDKDYGIDNQAEEDLSRGLQNIGISDAASSNPFRSQPTGQATGYNPFLSQGDNAQGYSTQAATTLNPFRSQIGTSPASYARHSGRRANTPAVGHSEYGHYASDHQQATGCSSGYLTPPQVPGQSGKRRSQTPAIGHSQPQQYASSLRRPQSAQDRSSARSSEHSSRSGSNMRGMKVQRQKDQRGFFKAGRVCVSEQPLRYT
jgi:hypothetical protein